MSPGFFAGLGRDSQAATVSPPHGSHSKLQGHALRKKKHGVCAFADRTTQILAPYAAAQRSTRQEKTSWPKVRGGLPAAMPDLVLCCAKSRSCPPKSRPTPQLARGHRASLPIPTTRGTVEASLLTARTARVLECSFLRPPWPRKPPCSNQRRTEVDSDVDRFLNRLADFPEDV